MSLNLEKQLRFYGAYHHNPVNVGIHIIFVPLILLTAFLFGTNTPTIPLPEWATIPYLPPNLGTLLCVFYSGFYILLEPVAGAMLASILFAGTAYANHLTATFGSKANNIAIGVHIFSWLIQFVGHGVFEGRAPALVDNLLQAALLAPLFVWLEVLFALGYRPELKSRLDKAVEIDISKFSAEKEKKRMNGHPKANGTTNGHAK